MDTVSQWFPPLTNREVITIVLGSAIAVITGTILMIVPFRRRLRSWAARQGYELVEAEALSSTWLDSTWRVTVRDASGRRRSGVVCFVGFEFYPDRLDIQWEDAGPSLPSFRRWGARTLILVWLIWLAAMVVFILPGELLLRPSTTPVALRAPLRLGVFVLLPVLFSVIWMWRRRK